jgi:hypothetical protein
MPKHTPSLIPSDNSSEHHYTKPITSATSPINDDYTSVQVGEDAYYSRYDSFGIADGVGGWASVGGSTLLFLIMELNVN